jgi:hypothetical protein
LLLFYDYYTCNVCSLLFVILYMVKFAVILVAVVVIALQFTITCYGHFLFSYSSSINAYLFHNITQDLSIFIFVYFAIVVYNYYCCSGFEINQNFVHYTQTF